MIESDFIKKYGLTIGMLLVASYVGSQIKSKLNIENTDEDEHKLIKEYILNDSPLYGLNRPKLWIHSKYEVNSRNWYSFGSMLAQFWLSCVQQLPNSAQLWCGFAKS